MGQKNRRYFKMMENTKFSLTAFFLAVVVALFMVACEDEIPTDDHSNLNPPLCTDETPEGELCTDPPVCEPVCLKSDHNPAPCGMSDGCGGFCPGTCTGDGEFCLETSEDMNDWFCSKPDVCDCPDGWECTEDDECVEAFDPRKQLEKIEGNWKRDIDNELAKFSILNCETDICNLFLNGAGLYVQGQIPGSDLPLEIVFSNETVKYTVNGDRLIESVIQDDIVVEETSFTSCPSCQ
jgi:hypothetical protein